MGQPIPVTDSEAAYMADGMFFKSEADAVSYLSEKDNGLGKVRREYSVIDSAFNQCGRYCIAWCFVTKAGRTLGMIYECGQLQK